MESDDLPEILEADAAYVLNAEHVCHDCGCIVQVFGVMLIGPFKGQAGRFELEDDDAPLLRRPTELPQALASMLTLRSLGRFRMDFSKTVGERYWMNHCSECGAKIGDWFIHKPGEAFFPTLDTEMAKVSGERVQGPLVFEAPDLSESSWTTAWLQNYPRNN